jgi:uncharacterized tellurite resistance protein B-like protein
MRTETDDDLTTICIGTSFGSSSGRSVALSPEDLVAMSVRCWVPFEGSAKVGTVSLPGGFYLGARLPSANSSEPDPCLVNPALAVDWHHPARGGEGMGYWPSYSAIGPRNRAAYLEWLRTGRSDPQTYIGYVFLYFYGLERRVLLDAAHDSVARADVAKVMAEVERLLLIYGGNRSFEGYSRGLFARAQVGSVDLDYTTLLPPLRRVYWVPPLQVKAGLAQFVVQGRPIPAMWALSWLVHDPNTNLRTPASRCPDEFRTLFEVKYREAHGDGLILKPNKTTLKASYRPASAAFRGEIASSFGKLPDVSVLQRPLKQLRLLADEVCGELGSYSRWRGKNETVNLAGLALLPPALLSVSQSAELAQFRSWVQGVLADQPTLLPARELTERWPGGDAGKVAKMSAESLGMLLRGFGVGMEPDPRFGGPSFSEGENVVLFRSAEEVAVAPGDSYRAAAVVLQLAAAVAAADGAVTEDEEHHLAARLEEALHLSPMEKTRLDAHLRWLLAEKPGLVRLKGRVASLSLVSRREIAVYLVGLAAADGRVCKEELKILGKVYALFGLAPEQLFSDAHALSAGSVAPPAVEPVTVRLGDPRAAGYAVPEPRSTELILDSEKIRLKLAETNEISRVLAGVFAEEPPTESDFDGEDVAPDGDGRLRLDDVHLVFLAHLVEREAWRRDELEALAERLGIPFLDAALETINEATVAACGEPAVEGDEVIEVECELAKELMA